MPRQDLAVPVLAADAFSPAPMQQLLGDDVHVWYLAPVDARNPPARGAAGAARAQRFLRRVLEAYLQRPLREDDVERGSHGKPSLRGREFSFNLTHAGDAAAVAIARDVDPGIDIEDLRRTRPALEIARRYFCASEAAALAALPPETTQSSFLSLWTAKEAVLKALGRGLAFGLDRLEFSFDGDDALPRRLVRLGDDPVSDEWQIVRFSVNPTLGGTLAWRGAQRRLRAFRAEADEVPGSRDG